MNRRNPLGIFAAALTVTAACLSGGSPASAQVGGQGIPDLSDFAGAIGKSVESGATAKSAAPGGVFNSGLTVPSVTPGATAKAIGKQLREGIEQKAGPQPKLAQLEAGMPQLLTELEGFLVKNGLAKRDFGIAYAYAFLTDWETANNQTVPPQPSIKAAKTIASAISKHWGPKFNSLTPAAKEKLYESLLISTFLMSTLTQQSEKAGKTQEAASSRQSAGQVFEKLTGVPPSQVKISPEGKITGLSAGTAAPAAPAAP